MPEQQWIKPGEQKPSIEHGIVMLLLRNADGELCRDLGVWVAGYGWHDILGNPLCHQESVEYWSPTIWPPEPQENNGARQRYIDASWNAIRAHVEQAEQQVATDPILGFLTKHPGLFDEDEDEHSVSVLDDPGILEYVYKWGPEYTGSLLIDAYRAMHIYAQSRVNVEQAKQQERVCTWGRIDLPTGAVLYYSPHDTSFCIEGERIEDWTACPVCGGELVREEASHNA